MIMMMTMTILMLMMMMTMMMKNLSLGLLTIDFRCFYCFVLLTNISSKYYNTLQEQKREEQSHIW